MPVFSPESLSRWTGGSWTSAPASALTGFTQDTRQLRTGQVFVALKTDRRDGHDFLGQALASGASAALVSKPDVTLPLAQLVVKDPLAAFQKIANEHRRLFKGPVVGVSGSCGKTSTKNLLGLLLGGDSSVLVTEGNLNNHLGVPLTLTRLEPSHRFAAIEAGISGPGEMDVLGGMIEPDVGVITLVAHAHTEELGGLDGVAREKARLLHLVRPGGLAVMPQQCREFAAFRDFACRSLVVVPEGTASEAPRQVVFRAWNDGPVTRLGLGGDLFEMRLVSAGMAQNAALAVSVARELGVTKERIQSALAGWRPAPLRGEIFHDAGRLFYVDCYNANPAAMADALSAFENLTRGDASRLFVLGGMEELGPEAAVHHRQLGERLPLKPADEVFAVGPFAGEVIAGVKRSWGSPAVADVVAGWQAVAPRLRDFPGPVFVKGSRRYELEKALPMQSAVSSHAHPC